MGSFTDKNGNENSECSLPAEAGQLQDPDRRHFSCAALAGGAVLLSLGNRSAWGRSQTIGCMSVMTLNSFDPTTGMFASIPAGRPGRSADAPGHLDGGPGHSANAPGHLADSRGHSFGRPGHNENLAAEIHRISLPPNYLGTDGTYSTCKDPDALDGICLVRGECPP